MFDFDFGKLMVVAIVALAVIPPKDLPRVMRTVGQVVGKMRRMAAEFQGQFMDAMREADLDSVRKELEALNDKAKVEAGLRPRRRWSTDDRRARASGSRDRPTSEAVAQRGRRPTDRQVRRELEALNEKAKADAYFDPKAAAPASPSPEPHATHAVDEAPAAKQSAAE